MCPQSSQNAALYFCAEVANVFLSAGELQELALLQPLVFPAQGLTSKKSMLVSQKKTCILIKHSTTSIMKGGGAAFLAS